MIKSNKKLTLKEIIKKTFKLKNLS